MMNKISLLLLIILGLSAFNVSCSDSETYADRVERERNAINNYITTRGIQVISESQFASQDYTTDTLKNQYVLFNSSGVYMQIVSKGEGEQIKNSETTDVLVRFTEYNLLTDTIQLSNMVPYFFSIVDKMSVTNTSGTFTGTFTTTSLMYSAYSRYSGTSVPSGWLTPLTYVNIGRNTSVNSLAHVRIIVPHDRGTGYASNAVTPFYYDLYFERGR